MGMRDGVPLTIEACDETMDFRNATVVLTPTASSLKLMTGGPGSISAGAGLSVYIESDEEVPEVSFATSEVIVDETDSTSVYLVASTMQGDEVGMADVMVTGDALISLFGNNVEAKGDGAYTVEFGEIANTRLMIRADADESLNEGDTKTATITLTDANGATVGSDNTVIVTVRGLTQETDPVPMPALPLISQLLLGLGLLGGGARQLYRRRRQG